MLDRMRDRWGLEYVRRALRAKLIRAVDEAVLHRQTEQIAFLEEQFNRLRDEVHRLSEQTANRVNENVRDLEIRIRRDIEFAGEHGAAREASDFVREHMVSARHCRSPHETLEYGLSLAPTGGLALEFGVYSGTTLKIISAARQGELVFGFDSFQGLPEAWRAGYPAGTFSVDGLPDVSGAELVVGLFDETLPGFLEANPLPVDILHVDSDLYSSAKVVLDLVGPRLHAGSVIVFDEFFNYPGWQQHEFKAWQEYVERTGVAFDYRAYTWDNEQVVVQITDV